MAKKLSSLVWIEDLLPEGVLKKPMFGGFAYYFEGRMVLALFENANDRVYQGKTYAFEIWFGCLFPAERSDHEELLRRYPFLQPHPVLGKWLYLPNESEDFEAHVEKIMMQIRHRSPLFGVIPPAKKTSAKKIRPGNKTPRMFSD